MALEIVRRIRGNLHGSIDVSALEDKVIDHVLFQRLRRIHQTAFLSYVFPGATHSRFEHSLGVMNLAGVAWSKLKSNQQRLSRSTQKYENFEERELKAAKSENHGLLAPTFTAMEEIFSSDYTLQALRLAALLHDVGHPPFSHSGERFLPSASALVENTKGLPKYLLEFLNELCAKQKAKGKNPKEVPVSHEVYTLILVDKLLNEIYNANPNVEIMVAPQDVISIIAPEIAPVEGSEIERLKVNLVCHELVSGEIDIDRMDYLQRDSKECGVVYGIFDAERILDSLSLYRDTADGAFHLAIQYSGLAAFEDYLRARQSMYLQLYFHKTSVAAEAMMQNIFSRLNDWRLPVDLDEYSKIDEHNIAEHLIKAADERVSDEVERAEIKQELQDLLFRRCLWKRVFEVSGASNVIRHNPTTEKAKAVISDLGFQYEQVSSASYLTKFRPRVENEASKNYLRLIKKDAKQFLRVFPIEDYSSLISNHNPVHITRLYVKNVVEKDGKSVAVKVQKAITAAFND